MNYWKPIAIASLCLCAGLAWLQFYNFKNAGDQTQTSSSGEKPATSRTRTAQGTSPGRGGRGGGRPPALVVAQPVSEALINDRLKAVGSGRAKASVSVVPLSGGLLNQLLVTSGQYVEKGAVLAKLDDQEQRIARDRSASLVDNAAIEEARLAQLFRSRTTSEAELIRARATLADARLALRDAELTLARREITAPIAGIVGLIGVDEGNYITPQTEIVTIDDRSTIVLEFWVPERFADQVTTGASIEATAQANPSSTYAGVITGVGSRVEADSRTLPVQAELNNDNDSLRPGMAFNIALSFIGQSYPAVDPLAVQWDSKGSFVWELSNNKVNRVPVQIIQRNPESVLVAAELDVGSKVVTEGLLTLRPGATVRVQGQTPQDNSGGKQDGRKQTQTNNNGSNKTTDDQKT